MLERHRDIGFVLYLHSKQPCLLGVDGSVAWSLVVLRVCVKERYAFALASLLTVGSDDCLGLSLRIPLHNSFLTPIY